MDPIFGFIIVVSALINFDNANTLKAENAVLEKKVEALKYATQELYTRHESVAEYVDEQSIEHEEDFIRLAASHAAATARRKHDIDENEDYKVMPERIDLKLGDNSIAYLSLRQTVRLLGEKYRLRLQWLVSYAIIFT